MLQKILKNFPRNRRKFYNFFVLGFGGRTHEQIGDMCNRYGNFPDCKIFLQKIIYFDHHFCSIAEHMRLMLRAYAAYAPLAMLPSGGAYTPGA